MNIEHGSDTYYVSDLKAEKHWNLGYQSKTHKISFKKENINLNQCTINLV